MDPDPDPEGPKTCGSSGSGSGFGSASSTLLTIRLNAARRPLEFDIKRSIITYAANTPFQSLKFFYEKQYSRHASMKGNATFMKVIPRVVEK
jgi:hypothetical protein